MNSKGARLAVWGVVSLLAVLHWDFWYWDDRTIVFGFLPVGLAYHAAFSLAISVAWMFAVSYAWPSHVEAWAEGGDEDDGRGDGR